MRKNNIKISIILPISRNESPRLLKDCLKSIKNQTHQPYEIITIINKTAKRDVDNVLKHYQVKIIKKDLTKSQSRNLGGRKAKGNYLLHLDCDNSLNKNTILKITKLLMEKDVKAVILSEAQRATNLLSRIRKIDYSINQHNKIYPSIRLVEKSLFKKVGGFDEEIDILDEWTLLLRIKREKVGILIIDDNLIEINDYPNLKSTIRRKFERGRFLPILKEKYPEFNEIINKRNVLFYFKNLKLFLEEPLALGLFLLKPVEWFSLCLGNLFPVYKNWYNRKSIAENYMTRRSSNYQLFKNYSEENALKLLLNPKPKSVIEVGAGTGRITNFLVKEKIEVLPTEPSDSMIKEYLMKKGLPKPVLAAAEDLKANMGKFDATIGIRVVWHIKNRQKHLKILKNASILSKKFIIFDFANAKRYKNPLFYILHNTYGLIFNRSFFLNNYFFEPEEINRLAKYSNLNIEKMIPLDLLTPFWLNLLPKKTARKFFQTLFSLEMKLSKHIPPGRWMVKFTRQ